MHAMHAEETVELPDDEESGPETRTSIRKERGECRCTGLVGSSARRAGMTCQALFQAAYAAEGKDDSYARGMLIAYIEKLNRGHAGFPGPVAAQCKAWAAKRIGTPPPASMFCLGCSVQEDAWAGLKLAYGMILMAHMAEQNGVTLESSHRARRKRFEQQERLIPPTEVERAAMRLESAWDTLDLSSLLDDELDDDWDELLKDMK